MNDQHSLEEQRLLRTRALRENGALVAGCAIAIVVLIAAYAALQWESAQMDSGRAGVALMLAVAFGVLGVAYLATPDSHAYSVMVAWAVFSLLGVHGFVWDACLGENSALLSAGHLPMVLAGLPLLSLVSHAFLLPVTAWRLTYAQLASAVALVVVYLSLHADQPLTALAAPLWTMGCLLMLPIQAALLGQLNSSHGEILNRELTRVTLDQAARNRRARERLLSDAISGGLNAQGLREKLQRGIAEGSVTAIAGITLADHARRREHMPLAEHRAMIGQVAQLLEHGLREGGHWGRYTETGFIVWRENVGAAALEQQLLKLRQQASFGERLVVLTAAVSADHPDATEATMALLHDVDNRLFLACLD